MAGIGYTAGNASSLLPYLQCGNPEIRLYLSLFDNHQLLLDRTYPFNVLDEYDATSKIVEAKFETDNGILLKRVLLQIQKDQYSLREHDITSASNVDIDCSWQSSFLCQDNQKHRGAFLSPQQDSSGQLQKLAPLFYCREKSLFFHPVCPSCGINLKLCVNDDLLQKHGLSQYSKSSKRYLYCAGCTTLGNLEFYLFERDPTDPVSAKDRWSLIDGFRTVDEIKDPDNMFPCARCSDRNLCYGLENRAKNRIVPFTFYPFYLLIHEAPSINIIDFLHLASGADSDELVQNLDQGRNSLRIHYLNTSGFQGERPLPLFSSDDERSFLEVLLLKLSVLQQVFRHIHLKNPENVITIKSDNIWVNLSTHKNTISSLWDFSISFLDSVNPRSQSQKVLNLETEIFTSLGYLWFEILLQNKTINKSEVGYSVKHYLSRRSMGNDSSGISSALDDICLPRNIFWQPDKRGVRQEWFRVWERTCSLGCQLLDSSIDNVESFTWNSFDDSIGAVISEIKNTLFHSNHKPSEVISVTDSRVNDDKLLGVVNRLIRKLKDANTHQPIYQSVMHDDDEDVATMIIPVGRQPFVYQDDVVTETVVLNSSQRAKYSSPDQVQTFSGDSGLAETMVFNRARPVTSIQRDTPSIAATVAPQVPDKIEDILGETIVIQSPGGRQRPRNG
ncbi:MAG: hypothetical protein ACOYL3_19990 [Desulfuromonadaceae bacterium]